MPISSTLELLGGAVLMAAALLDVFLTVLYARAGTGILSPFVTRGAWRLFRVVARAFGRRGALVLSVVRTRGRGVADLLLGVPVDPGRPR